MVEICPVFLLTFATLVSTCLPKSWFLTPFVGIRHISIWGYW